MNPFRWFSLVLLLLLFPASLRAQFSFATNNGALVLTNYSGSDSAVAIPAATNGLPVVAIANAFRSNPNIISISVPASVTNYSTPSFTACSNLIAVYFAGVAPKDHFPAAGPVFYANSPTLYYVRGTPGWPNSFDGLDIVAWDPQVLTQLSFITNSGAIIITGYNGPGGPVVLPATINGWPVGTIGARAFQNSPNLASIAFPVTVTNIGDFAFAGCVALTNAAIPPAVCGVGVFSNCPALAGIVLLTNVYSLTPFEFSGCLALQAITIPGNVTNVAADVFQNCSNLNALYFQGNAPVVDPSIFDGAPLATNYYFPRNAGWTATLAGRPTFPIEFTFTTNSGVISLSRYIGIGGSVVIPDTINGYPVTTLGNATFTATGNLTNIVIGTNITGIAGQAFVGCSALLAINVDPQNAIFSSLDGVLFNKNRTTILYYPGGRVGSYAIPDGVTSIPSYAFQACNGLTTLTVPASVTSIGSLGFNADPVLTAIYFRGNAPTVASFGFEISASVVLYHLPGTSGWTSNLGGLGTAIWRPAVPTADASFGVKTNNFGFTITWAAGMTVVVESSSNLANPVWLPLQTNSLSADSAYFADPLWTNYTKRYYRLRAQ